MEMNYDEITLHQLEEELHTTILPGTEIMSDVGTHHFVKSHADRVLVPQPSADPNDPLNWSKWWKFSAMSLSTAVTFAQGMGPLALAPMFGNLIETFDTDLAGAVQFTGVCILVLGFSNFIWVPLQTSLGRRPVLLLSTHHLPGEQHLESYCEGLQELHGCLHPQWYRCWTSRGVTSLNAIQRIIVDQYQTAQPTIITDVMFLHERGFWNTLYFTFYFGCLMVGPIISGPIAIHSNWRNFWWLNVALHGIIFVLLVFFFPETKWHRLHPKEIPKITASSEEKIENSNAESADREVPMALSTQDAVLSQLTASKTAERDPYLGKGSPSKKQFGLYSKNTLPMKSILLDLWIPWKLFTFPIVGLSSFIVSWSASSFLALNLTQYQAFGAAPYNWSSQNIGFTNFAMLVGTCIGLATNGKLSDMIAARATKRNNGIREPEMRLPAMIPYVLIMLLGNIIVAFGYQHSWDWRVIVIIGYTCIGIQVAALPAIASTYAVDSYKPVAGSVFVAITVNKNVWGYGFSKFITPWIDASGYVPPIMLNMSLTLLWCACAVIFFMWGKTFRKWTRSSKVHYM